MHLPWPQAAARTVATVGKDAGAALQGQAEADWRALKALRRRFSGGGAGCGAGLQPQVQAAHAAATPPCSQLSFRRIFERPMHRASARLRRTKPATRGGPLKKKICSSLQHAGPEKSRHVSQAASIDAAAAPAAAAGAPRSILKRRRPQGASPADALAAASNTTPSAAAPHPAVLGPAAAPTQNTCPRNRELEQAGCGSGQRRNLASSSSPEPGKRACTHARALSPLRNGFGPAVVTA